MSPAKCLVMNWNILPGLTFCISICILYFNSIFLRTGNYEQHGWDQTHRTVFCLHVWLNHTPLFPRKIVFYAVIFLTEEVMLWAYDQECNLCLTSIRIQHRHRIQCVIKHTQCRASEHKQLTYQLVTCLSWRSDQMVKSNTDISSSVFCCMF